jgi:hypothetical protein
MQPKLPALLSGFGIGGLLVATGIYGLAYMHFSHQKKLSDMVTNKQYRWVFIGMVAGGAILAISDVFFDK